MSVSCRRPVVIIEGAGDRDAIPYLIRYLSCENGIYDVTVMPNPIMKQCVPSLRQPGQLERFLTHAIRRECDSILVILDADSDCPKEVSREFVNRARQAQSSKKIGFCFSNCEFEALFLFCLDLIAEKYPDYGWNLREWQPDRDYEAVRGAKEYISRLMKSGRAYKEIGDQAKFINALSFDRLRSRSRSFRHFEAMLMWMLRSDGEADRLFPNVVRYTQNNLSCC